MTEPAHHGPYTACTAARSACPVQVVSSGPTGRSSYLVTGYAEARQALGDARLSKDTAAFFAGKGSSRALHPALVHHMLASDPPEHTRLRKLVTGAFTTGAVAELRPAITRITDELLDRWTPDEPFDFVAGLAGPLPVTVICELLGVPDEDRPSIRRWSAELFAAAAPDVIDAASHSLATYMTELVASKRAHPGTNLLDRLIAAHAGDDALTENELVSLAVLLLVAGHETTTNYLGNALLALLLHPAERDRLRAHPDAIPAALDELLRYDSPVSTATFRFTTERLTLGGTEIPAGRPVLIALGAANRDPARFAAPDTLDLTRDAAGHLAFGHGIHRCLGAPLAKAEAEIALGAVLRRFPAIQLAVPPEHIPWRRTRLVRGPESLPVLHSGAEDVAPLRPRG
ncbi:cytochrome P450 family protein [Streptomyces sp. Tu6071]|uniref:cytochrome P450 family protein n=1 Tax=Streptomyces sp. Tu6071 TaxID=355249 RepID=UPI0002F17CE9|nr:cytochrome P450 [Streptomyces sp. Tu6071]